VAYDPENDRYLVVWSHDRTGNGDLDLYGRLIPRHGPDSSLVEFPIYSSASDARDAKVVYAAEQKEFLVVWQDVPASGPKRVMGQRIKAADRTLPTGSKVIASHGTDNYYWADVAYNLAENEYLVTFARDATGQQWDIYAVRLRGDGEVLGGGEFPISTSPDGEFAPAVAACPQANQYLVVWASWATTQTANLIGQFVRAKGGLDGGPIPIQETPFHEGLSDVACSENGQQYLVAWQQSYQGNTSLDPVGIWGRLILANKRVERDFEITWPVPPYSEGQPYVAGGASNYLVVWEHSESGIDDVYGRLVSPYAVFLPMVVR
jgi:hypothetical protein